MAINFGSVSNANSSNVTITSGNIDGTTIGASTPAAGTFSSLSHTGSQTLHSTTITGNYTVVSTDEVVLINNNPGAALTITLPASPNSGRFLRFKDIFGNASTYHVTIAGNGKLIDGNASLVLSVDHASVDLMYNGSSWSLFDLATASGISGSTYDPTAVAITGGSIDGTTIGATTPSTGAFTSLTSSGAVVAKVAVVTTGASYTCSSSDYTVVINKTTGSATAVTLPSSPSTGRLMVLKDGKGDAATHAITISPAAGTIDGASSFVMNVNYSSATLVYNGSEWSII